MNESSSNKEQKSSNIPPGGGGSLEESKRNDLHSSNSKNPHSQATDKLKRGLSGFQNPAEIKEDEKVPDTEENNENILHGPDESIFIKNQKISKKESLNQKKYYFQRNITKEQEEAEIKMKLEKEKKEKEKAKKQKNISRQHAVIQFRKIRKEKEWEIVPYLIDLNSTNGTYLNGDKIDNKKYFQIKKQKEMIKEKKKKKKKNQN